jgi:hypothetical protein
MSQLNIHMTPAFERALKKFMRAKGIKTKSEAVRIALQEAAERAGGRKLTPLEDLLGAANRYPHTPREQWLSDDDLWSRNGR